MTNPCKPSIGEIKSVIAAKAGNIIPVYEDISADLVTPVSAYLRLAEKSDYSFLFESVSGGEKIGRYSYLGANPYKVIRTGDKESVKGDPLVVVEKELAHIMFVPVAGVPDFTGGAVGYIAYDCVRYFEPRTARDLKDPIGIPDAVLMFCDTIVIFDHLHHIMRVVSHFRVDNTDGREHEIEAEYARVTAEIARTIRILSSERVPMPVQPPIVLDEPWETNFGQEGYEGFVHALKHHINEGDIIQAVPSRRTSKRTNLHPFNAYRHLRSVNPSPYMFYVDVKDFQIVGASPEMLVKVENDIVYTHPIAGTRKRGKTPEEDDALAADLLGDLKERSEHIMLVDLGRNDVNRICIPSTVKVDSLMHIERYSHVMHIVSNVSGRLRPGKTRFDAFRSIFPAGTVSGAPKVKAMELIYELEAEKRGIYAGAVGYFTYAGGLNTGIAIRTMLFKDGHVYLQAGAGIVYDSVPTTEYEETTSKLKSNVTAIEKAEMHYYTLQKELKTASVLEQILYLSELGANVEVYRNDQVTLEECIAINPRNIVISPGPGRPADAAVSNEVIRHFAGKVPIMGVCLGEQCMYEVYGGKVTYAGEIVHGKTSPVTHDGRGLYEGVPQRIETTRYHSLAGDPKTLPDVLEITSWTDSGVVMGIRHKEFVMEGIQYHPESIASEYGKVMFANFLRWEGGTWDQLKVRSDVIRELDDVEKQGGAGGSGGKRSSPGGGIPLSKVSKLNSTATAGSAAQDKSNGTAPSSKGPTILERIRDQRLVDIAASRSIPGNSDYHLQRSIACGVPLPNIDFPARVLQNSCSVAVMAEIKRASPSKGNIDISAHAPTQALLYADGGASVISVLTEPKWFKGSLEDMRQVRQALNGIPNRPAVLRKDFIIDRYQILEARVYGADTLLLIVAILNDTQLRDLLSFSRQLGMEPLVEVANAEEMRRAVAVGSRVIGVNNRDLHTFTVDMNRTSSLASLVPEETILVALSGITGRADVEKYVSGGAKGVLVGEALMRCADKRAFIQGLLGASLPNPPTPATTTMAKICGITNTDDALAAAQGGADLIGLIFAKSPRQVDAATAASIVERVRGKGRLAVPVQLPFPDVNMRSAAWFNAAAEAVRLRRSAQETPLFVGVFSNHSVAEINRIVSEAQLDLVQFHGDEPPDLARLIRVPVIKAFHIHAGETSQQVLSRAQEARGTIGGVLLDTAVKGLAQQGGSGETFDWDVAAGVQAGGVPILLAGGLNAKNVKEAIEKVRPWCVDVSSGVELDGVKGKKDHAKVLAFLRAVKGVQ
ncbi:bifunctional tryptophan synthase trp1 [Borealophlyctis nickersoniae]|nr:bifunctional tryptophan synthase trp1 [Borealophlyctis nickersoniae]